MANDLGKLILRLTLGVLILLHGIAKISGGIAGIEKMLEGNGLPGFLALGVYVGEILAPILVVLLAHRADLLQLTKTGGWALELQAFFLFTAVAVALIGPGRFGINHR